MKYVKVPIGKVVRFEDDEQIIELTGFEKNEAVEMIDRIRTATIDVTKASGREGVEIMESHNGTSRRIQTETSTQDSGT